MNPDLKYLQLLSKSFPNIQAASTEIINLEAILNLPKGTEHFLTDLHGESEAFHHVLQNGSGVVKKKVEETFGHTLREAEKKELCTLIYYPSEKLKLVRDSEEYIDDWYIMTLQRLVLVCANVSSKYTRSKVRKALPSEYSYIIQELLHESQTQKNKQDYIYTILSTIVSTYRADHFIIAICNLIKRLTIDTLHIVGDIYDRGDGAHIIMDTLCDYHNVDIQWGNHDLIWMGAAAGSEACMANVLRICLRYANLRTLDEGYGINLLPLASFAMDVYKDDECKEFMPKMGASSMTAKELSMTTKMHKAITIIQLKLEGQIIAQHPEFEMDDRRALHRIDYKRGVVVFDDKEYELKSNNFPTINPDSPYELSAEESEIVAKLMHNFTSSVTFRKHIRCLYSCGSLYLVKNGNLLYHGSVPMNEDGSFRELEIEGVKYSGKPLFDKIDKLIRVAYFGKKDQARRKYAQDFVWYLWCGPSSPPFDKNKMATFEGYFCSEPELKKESKGYYNVLKVREDICDKILDEFDVVGDQRHIINGHIPVKTTKGETPVKANGKLLVIDGGYSKAYQSQTGIAGYTLIYNSHGLLLIQHQPFESKERSIETGEDIISTLTIVEYTSKRQLVRDTDIGKELQQQVSDLKNLLVAYRKGDIR